MISSVICYSSKINTNTEKEHWLNRAAQSLAEALRMTVSGELDIEFTGLVTGCRIHRNGLKTCTDIYIYGSLSSSAGYAVGVMEKIPSLLKRIEQGLSACDCAGACHKSLKHYRNQHIHGMLDRFYALQLLRWGMYGVAADPVGIREQREYISALENILGEYGCRVSYSGDSVTVNGRCIEVYPAMWLEPAERGKIFVSDAYMRFSKPYAVHKIIAEC